MSFAQALLTEFEQQAPITEKFLQRLPEEKLGWKPHQKSLTAGQLAMHLATVPGSVVKLVGNNPAQVPVIQFAQPMNLAEVLGAFHQNRQIVRELLPGFTDSQMCEPWKLMQAEREFLVQPRAEFVRNIMLNHWYQHRGQMSVYLRLLNVPVPASWGPSADERFSLA